MSAPRLSYSFDPTEAERRAAFAGYAVLDTPAEQAYDDIVKLATMLCATPAAVISLLDGDRQWFKARIGVPMPQAPRRFALCEQAAGDPGKPFEIDDIAGDPRLRDYPVQIVGRPVRFYAAAPLLTPDGITLGSVCVMDVVPRRLDERQRDGLAILARQTQHLLELRRHTREQRRRIDEQQAVARKLERARADLQQRHRELQQRADHDPLTGLLNRAALVQLREDPQAMARLQAGAYVLMLVDVDHFKQVNDRHGHLLGDRALRAVGDAIAASVREGDVAARFGGEEFLVVLPGTRLPGAAEVAERIRTQVAQLALPFGLTVSIGLAAGEPTLDHPEQVFDRADQALYRAKAAGRDRVVADDTLRIAGPS
jgi:diguanylate cyclase (GGDEF)-like protein